ncbi:MAG: ABC transporter permease [Spirochaetota bacterium]|nr:ABC transporter permease [Spirochaetota bacterium]
MIIIEKFGQQIFKQLHHLGQITILFSQTVSLTFKRPFSKKNLIDQMIKIGINSSPVALITALTVGMILSLMFGSTMERKMQGSKQFTGAVVGLTFVQEIGPVLTALMVTGRIGSAIAAELGTMKITEQIDALITLSANPIQYLAVPRFLASLTMFPALVIMADIVGIIGGWIIAVLLLDLSTHLYISYIITYVKLSNVMVGLVKAVVFGGLMSIISCYNGFNTFGGAEGVGKSTTRAVVISSMAIIISDYFVNAIFIVFFRV